MLKRFVQLHRFEGNAPIFVNLNHVSLVESFGDFTKLTMRVGTTAHTVGDYDPDDYSINVIEKPEEFLHELQT